MENSSKNTAAIITMIILVLLVGFLFFNGRSSKKALKQEKALYEQLNLKSNNLQNEFNGIKDELARTSRVLNDSILKKQQIIEENQARIRALSSETRLGNDARKKLQELEGENTRLQSEISTIQEDIKTLETQSEELKTKIAELEKENSNLKGQNELLSSMITDNVQVTATRGKKSKLTVVACRTGLISAYLDIPSASTDNLNFSILYPDGSMISSINSAATSLNVSSSSSFSGSMARADMRYVPETRLKKGLYKLSVYSNDTYLTGVYLELK